MSILFRNIRTADCNRELRCDVLLRGGVIAALGDNLVAEEPAQVVDGRGLTLLPSFVDLHVHFRDPGLTHKEDVYTGCRAAVHGGYTTVNLMPNTKPVISDLKAVRFVEEKARELDICDVYQTLSITKDSDGSTLSHLESQGDLGGVKWLTDDGNGIVSTQVMLDAMRLARRFGVGVMLHEEDKALTPVDSYLSEDLPTYRDVRLAALTGCRTHFCHVSTAESLSQIVSAREKGAPVSFEVTPHHLYLNDGNGGRVAPPLRSEGNRQALIQAVKDGVVDAIATDHAPHTPEDKAAGMNGFTGLDLSFATCYTVLCKQNGLPLTALSRLMSYGPARLMGIPGGLIELGQPANLAVVDLDSGFVAAEEHIHSKSKNSPLLGESLWGEVLMTVKNGKVVYEKQA